MAFGDRFKKIFKSSEKEKNDIKPPRIKEVNFESPDNEEINVDPENIEKPTTNNIRNFKYLDDLIHKGVKEIVLDSDIVLDDLEQSQYSEGIKIDVDYVVIDGNGHSIDAKNKVRIFIIHSKEVIIKNISLINGFSSSDGGAVFNQKGSNVNMINCKFKDNTAKRGGAIYNYGQINLNDNKFINNLSNESDGGAIFNNEGSAVINACEFKGNTTKRQGGAILNNDAVIDIVDCIFENNVSEINAGALINYNKMNLENSKFFNNSSHSYGGALATGPDSINEIINCKFKDNTTRDSGGVILNWGKINLKNSEFFNNTTGNSGGAISNNRLINSNNNKFHNNSAEITGGAIMNDGQIYSKDDEFLNNRAEVEIGGAIYNSNSSTMEIINSIFKNNKANNGGAIINWGKLKLVESEFNDNTAKLSGGAVYNVLGSLLSCQDSLFKNNKGAIGSSIFNESNDMTCIHCIFSQHRNDKNIIYNKNDLNILNSTFNENTGVDNIILTDTDSKLNISGGKVIDNNVKKSAIMNKAKSCNIKDTTFKNNNLSPADRYGADIFNETELSLQSPKIAGDDAVLNLGHIDVKKLPHSEVERIIRNAEKGIVDEFSLPDESTSDFTFLKNLIEDNDEDVICLKSDISLGNYELDFFEGGIEITKDNITIDGNNHTITGRNKSRIFIIAGKNVTLKNIIFKDGFVGNDFDENISGGGAIHIIKDCNATLENCQFIDNTSESNAGAILNNGTLCSQNNIFVNNNSQNNGGAIYNNGLLNSIDDCYDNNKSIIAGAIYNNHDLTIKNDISLSNNNSQFKQDIYNANNIEVQNSKINIEEIIYNTNNVNNESVADLETLEYLKNELKKSNEILLQKDIKIKYADNMDEYIIIEDEIIFDGNGHVIDFNNFNFNFKVNADVIIKNVIFKNAHLKNPLFENNDNKMEFENVTFLNNKTYIDSSLIINNGTAIIFNSNFLNNICQNDPLIKNINDLEITNSKFINNRVYSNYSLVSNKHDVFGKARLSVANSYFKSNFNKYLGGTLDNGSNDELIVTETKFIKNHAKTNGGAITNAGNLKLKYCVFNNNSSNNGGTIYCFKDSSTNISNCEFNGNAAIENGGAIISWGNISITDSNFDNNSVLKGGIDLTSGNGGAIHNSSYSTIEISNTEFNNNTAQTSGGAIYNIKKDNLKVDNCNFNNNSPNDIT